MGRRLAAGLTALLLLVFAAPDVLVSGATGAHAHAHGSHTGGWIQQTADHAPHESSQLEAAATVRHPECAACTGRVRPHVSVLGFTAALSRQDGRAALPLAARPAVSTSESSPNRPRAPPAV